MKTWNNPAKVERDIRDLVAMLNAQDRTHYTVELPMPYSKRPVFNTQLGNVKVRLEEFLGTRIPRAVAKEIVFYQYSLDPSSNQRVDIETLVGGTLLGQTAKRYGLMLSVIVTRKEIYICMDKVEATV